MPVFDTPITTNEQNLPRVVAQTLPVVVYLYNSRDKALDDALAMLAKEHAGKLLIARVDVADNPGAHAQYGRPTLPALITLSGGTVKSKAEGVRPIDLRPHIDYLLGRGAMPAQKQTQQQTFNGQGNASSTPVHVTDSSFQRDVLGSDVPVLVDFWAEWCGPCKMIAPYLEQVAREFGGKVKIAKLNVDQNPRVSQQYDIRSIPTFITFKNGRQIARQSGASQPLVRDMIQKVLSA
jgi:thioredoxin 1